MTKTVITSNMPISKINQNPNRHPLHPKQLLWYMRLTHHHALARPHGKLVEKSRVYASWHGKQHHGKVHAFALAMYVLVAIAGVSGLSQVAHAFNSWLQVDWVGGTGTSTVNQYSSTDNVITTSTGLASLGPTTTSDWCNTSLCDTSWSNRKQIEIAHPDRDFNGYQVQLTIPAQPGVINSDYSDLRFTNQAGSTDLPYFIRSSSSNSALVFVKVTDSNPNTSIYMYYGNSSATAVSDSTTVLDFYDDFNGSTTVNAPGNYNDGKFGGPLATGTITEGGGILAVDAYADLTAQPSINRSEPASIEMGLKVYSCTNTSSPIGLYTGNYYNTDELYTFSVGQCSGGHFLLEAARTAGPSYTHLAYIANQELNTDFKSYRIDITPTGADYYVDSQSNGAGTNFAKVASSTAATTSGPFSLASWFDNTHGDISYIYSYKTGGIQGISTGGEEYQGGRVGTLTSSVFDTQMVNPVLGVASLTAQGGNGGALLRVRASANADMSGALDFAACPWLGDGVSIATGNPCVGNAGEQYLQYQLFMAGDSNSNLEVSSIGVEYGELDTTAPSAIGTISATAGSGGKTLADGGWTNLVNGPNAPLAGGEDPRSPAYTWGAATDNQGGSGILGYCLYFGEDPSADPLTTKGMISNASALDTGNACPYAVAGTSFDIADINLQGGTITDPGAGKAFYFRVRALDGANNASASTTQHSFLYDSASPFIFTPTVNSTTIYKEPKFDINWLTQLDFGYGLAPVPIDNASGVAGIKYCIAPVTNTIACFLAPDAWYGVNGTPGTDLTDTTGAAPAGPGVLHVDATSNPYVDPNGVNVVYVVALDNAANLTNNTSGGFNPAIIQTVSFHSVAPTAPLNLAVTPSTNTTNSFSFSWDAPSDLAGRPGYANYCWSVNILPDAQHCNFAGAGITSLSADAYAMQPGQNTMYVVARDEAGNIDYANRASVNFTSNTTAPGAPRNLEVIDASNKATSSWKLALSWDVPLLSGSGVHHYKILRSVDDLTYSEVGSTTATSFVDSGLSQILYYYKVEACDNANNCSAASASDSLLPTGRYTDPANLVAGPQVRDIKTRSATVFWSTDRFSDSKVAYGTSSGNYFPAEAYQSAQVTGHSLELSSLSPGTTYFYRAKWTDNDGNTGQSAEMQFTTQPAPIVSDVTVSSVNLDRATIRFTSTGATRVKVYYGTSALFGSVVTVNTSTDNSTYSVDLPNLNDGTRYFYRVSAIDTSGYEYDGSVASFTTIARPRITNLRFQSVEGEPSSTQKITWDTNVPSSSELSYGPLGGKQIEAVNSELATSHEMIIRNLQDDTLYSLIARSRDSLGNLAISDLQQFRTALDTRPPGILDVNAEASVRGTGAEARGQIIVTWKTDEPSTSQVSYGSGVGANPTTKTSEDARLTTDHIVIISDVPTSSVYSVHAISRDKGDNLTTSDYQSVVVGRGSDNIFSIIFNAIQQIFGFKL